MLFSLIGLNSEKAYKIDVFYIFFFLTVAKIIINNPLNIVQIIPIIANKNDGSKLNIGEKLIYENIIVKTKIKFPPIRHRAKIRSILTNFIDLLRVTCSKIIIKEITNENNTIT